MNADQLAGTALVIIGAGWLLKYAWDRTQDWAQRGIDRMVADGLAAIDEEDLMQPGALDRHIAAEEAAWLRLLAAVDDAAAFEAEALAEIEALTKGQIQ